MSSEFYFPGRDFDSSPVDKAERALSMTAKLRSEFDAYRHRLGDVAEVSVSGDRLTATVRARLVEEPPAVRWSMEFGDIIHNYRAALDSFAWALVHLDGAEPDEKTARSIYFPAATTPQQWEGLRRKQLATAPDVVLDRLELQQPFKHPPVEQSVGLTLNRLENHDKHRSTIRLAVPFTPSAGLAIVSSYVDGRSPGPSTYDELNVGKALEDGMELFRVVETVPLEHFSVNNVPLSLTVDDQGRALDVFRLLELIDRQVTGVFMAVCAGIAPNTQWHQYVIGQGPRPQGTWYPTAFYRGAYSA